MNRSIYAIKQIDNSTFKQCSASVMKKSTIDMSRCIREKLVLNKCELFFLPFYLSAGRVLVLTENKKMSTEVASSFCSAADIDIIPRLNVGSLNAFGHDIIISTMENFKSASTEYPVCDVVINCTCVPYQPQLGQVVYFCSGVVWW
jgi:hypothetical protein